MDPGRDTPAELLAYAKLTGATWPLLRGDVASTFQFWFSLHAGYSKGAAPSPDPTDWYTGQPETYHLDHDSLAVVFDQNGTARYLLQGNPGLGHALSPALQALMNPAKLPGLEQTAAWTITDLLDRVDAILGAPPEASRGTEQAARPGSRAPQLSLPGLDGRQVSVQSQLGRPTVVTFWATWCTACRQDFPALAAAARTHPNLSVLAVDEAESAAQVRDYLHSLLGADAARFTALLDGDRSAGGRYALPGLPVTVFVGADGIVQQVTTGQFQGDDLAHGLAAIGA
jgi:thiol-disulfide isomerase/thioredoxin